MLDELLLNTGEQEPEWTHISLLLWYWNIQLEDINTKTVGGGGAGNHSWVEVVMLLTFGHTCILPHESPLDYTDILTIRTQRASVPRVRSLTTLFTQRSFTAVWADGGESPTAEGSKHSEVCWLFWQLKQDWKGFSRGANIRRFSEYFQQQDVCMWDWHKRNMLTSKRVPMHRWGALLFPWIANGE